MKRILLFILILVMVLPLAGCKSAEVRTLESGPAIEAVEDAMAAMPWSEVQKAENLNDYILGSKCEFWSLLLPHVGAWCDPPVDYFHLERQMQGDSVFHEDGTFTASEFFIGPDFLTGTWEMEGGDLKLVNADGMDIRFQCWVQDGKYNLSGCIPAEEFRETLDGHVKIVDVTAENWSDYMEFFLYDRTGRDQFGDPDGTFYTQLMLRNTLLGEGWMCYAADDFIMEVLIPEHEVHRVWADGDVSDFTQSANEWIWETDSPPFSYGIYDFYAAVDTDTTQRNLALSDVQMGRIQGRLYFIRAEDVIRVENDDGARVLVLEQGIRIWAGHYFDDLEY